MTMPAATSGIAGPTELRDEGLEAVLVSSSFSSCRDDRERKEPNKLEGRVPLFIDTSLSRPCFEFDLDMPASIGLEAGDSGWPIELGRRFLRVAGALSGGSSLMGVKGANGGRKIVKLFRRRLSGISGYQCSWLEGRWGIQQKLHVVSTVVIDHDKRKGREYSE